MRHPSTSLAALSAVLLAALALTGCATAAPPAKPAHSHLSVVPQPTATRSQVQPLDQEIVDTVWVIVYPGTQFRAAHGCGCTLKGDSSQELFPKGTPVVLLKIALSGAWKPSQGSATTQDVTGVNLTGTRFDGRPENAVLDTKDGPAAAKKLGLPWLPAGLFGSSTEWTIPNNKLRSFAAAWYLPAGVNRLLLTVDVPSEPEPNHLVINIPQAALALTEHGGE